MLKSIFFIAIVFTLALSCLQRNITPLLQVAAPATNTLATADVEKIIRVTAQVAMVKN